MAKNLKVAAVQLNISKPINSIINDIRRYMHNAKTKKVDMICFPEDSISLGPKKNKLIISQVMECCKLYGIWCIISTHLKEKKYHYNSALLIDNEGNLSGKHQKVHIMGDGPKITPGSKFDVYKTPFCKIGIAICWDVSNPRVIYSMAKKGAKIIFCPMYWCYDDWAHKKNHKKAEKKILQSLILARAYESLTYVIFCNPIDVNEKYITSYTAIASPHKIVKEIFGREGMVIAKIELKSISEIRKKMST